ncbi:hypothetical protein [Egbenema bharatensis]|uniref:hypothetical protein n=1 Tax=Egbenema bharatensis TaxID=3463334 RepID=UPI003A8BB35E
MPASQRIAQPRTFVRQEPLRGTELLHNIEPLPDIEPSIALSPPRALNLWEKRGLLTYGFNLPGETEPSKS